MYCLPLQIGKKIYQTIFSPLDIVINPKFLGDYLLNEKRFTETQRRKKSFIRNFYLDQVNAFVSIPLYKHKTIQANVNPLSKLIISKLDDSKIYYASVLKIKLSKKDCRKVFSRNCKDYLKYSCNREGRNKLFLWDLFLRKFLLEYGWGD